MRPVEPGPARGSFFSLQCALAAHVGVGEDAAPFVEQPFAPLPLFRVVGRLARAFLLLQAGRPQEAAASYQEAGPLDGWSLPPFAVPLAFVYGVLVAAELGRHEELAALAERLEPFRGEHASIQAVAYLGPVELALGRDGPGDRARARPAARDADRLARALGMAAYRDRAAALVARLGDPGAGRGP
jgi:hypothetical protein